MPKPKLMLNKSSSTHSISDKSKQTVYNIEEWSEFEDSMESFINDSINKDDTQIYQKKTIEEVYALITHGEYKSLIYYICNAIFSNCLLRKIRFTMEFRVQSLLIDSKAYVLNDICCLNISDSETLAIFEIKTISDINFEDKAGQVLKSKDLIKKFNNGKKNNFKKSIEQLYSYMIIKNTKYGMLSIYNYTIFVQIVDRNNEPVLRISNPVQIDSFLKATFYILSESINNYKIKENVVEYIRNFENSKKETFTFVEKSINSDSLENNVNQNRTNLESSNNIVQSTNIAYTCSKNLRSNIEYELEYAFFYFIDIIGSGRIGDVLKLKIDSNDKFLAFKFIDIYTKRKNIKQELKNEIQVYKWLQKASVECIPKLVNFSEKN